MDTLSSSSTYQQAALTPNSFKVSNPTPDQATFLGKQVEEVTVKPKTKRPKMTLEERKEYNKFSAKRSRNKRKQELAILKSQHLSLSRILEEKKQENAQLKEDLVDVTIDIDFLEKSNSLLTNEQSRPPSESDEPDSNDGFISGFDLASLFKK